MHTLDDKQVGKRARIDGPIRIFLARHLALPFAEVKDRRCARTTDGDICQRSVHTKEDHILHTVRSVSCRSKFPRMRQL